MRIRGAIFGGLVVVASLFLGPVRLQGWGNTWTGAALEMLVAAAHARLGPLKYEAALLLTQAGHASDIYYGSTLNPVPDFIFTAGPSVHFLLPVQKKVVFDIYELPQYVFYLDTKRDRTLNNTFLGLVHFVFDRLYFQAGGGLIDVKERLSTELNINVRRREDRLNGMALWQISKGASLAVQYRRITYNYENLTPEIANIREGLNRTESYVNATTYLEQHAKTRFYLDGEYGSYKFAELVSQAKNSRTYGLFGGVDFLPPAGGYEGQTSGMRGRVNIGFKSLSFLDSLHKGYSGLAGNTSVSVGIMPRTAVHVLFSRGPQFSVYSGIAYYLQTAYGAGLSRSLTKRILFTYDFSYSRNNYPESGTSGGVLIQNGIDKYMTHSFRLGFQLKKDLELSFLANVGRRDSLTAFRPISDYNFFGFNLIYGYPSGTLTVPTGPLH